MEIVLSINSVPIRLTSERWVHIVENHDDLAGQFHEVLEAVADPHYIVQGGEGELLAVREHRPLALIVVYREMPSKDGFIITAFQTSKPDQLTKHRLIIWRKPQSKKH